jgi:hypothetical protein
VEAIFALPLAEMLFIVGIMGLLSLLFVGTVGLINPVLRESPVLLFCVEMIALHATFTSLKDIFRPGPRETLNCPLGSIL